LSSAPSSPIRSAGTSFFHASYASSSRGMPRRPRKTVGKRRSAGSVQTLGQQLPGQRDRLGLEVVAEREVAEHLEERVVPQRRPDVVEVVVLAAHAHALLRRRRARVVALLAAEEDVLELVHPRVREEQRRVVARHERRARDDGVAVAAEEVQEAAADLAGTHAGAYSIESARPPRFRSAATTPAGVKPWRIRYW
jgi:hypothetical protein